MKKLFAQKIYITFLLCLSVLTGYLYFGQEVYADVNQTKSDSINYYQVLDFLKGDNPDFLESKNKTMLHTRVLMPLLALPFSFFVANNYALAIVNLIFVFLSAVVIWLISANLFKEKVQIANLSGILYIGSLPIIAYGSRPLSDSISFFFFFLIIYLSLICDYQKMKDYVYLFIVLALAFLHKESAFFALILPFTFLLFSKKQFFFQKIIIGFKIILTTLFALIPVRIWQFFMKASWLKHRGIYYRFVDGFSFLKLKSALFVLFSRTFLSFHILYLPFAYGIYKIPKKRLSFFLQFMSSGIVIILATWLLAPPFSPRFLAFASYFILPISAFGIVHFFRQNWQKYTFVFMYYLISTTGALMFPNQPIIDGKSNLFKIGLDSLLERINLFF